MEASCSAVSVTAVARPIDFSRATSHKASIQATDWGQSHGIGPLGDPVMGPRKVAVPLPGPPESCGSAMVLEATTAARSQLPVICACVARHSQCFSIQSNKSTCRLLQKKAALVGDLFLKCS